MIFYGKLQKDAKGRKLGKGESYRSDGRYCYSYTICGERKWLYASDLAELRELERRIEHDKDDGIRTQEASKITLNDMFETYIATKPNSRPAPEKTICTCGINT